MLPDEFPDDGDLRHSNLSLFYSNLDLKFRKRARKLAEKKHQICRNHQAKEVVEL